MSRERKMNDNGLPPGCPENLLPEPAGMAQALTETVEDVELREALAARREGLNADYTKAPWRAGMVK